MFYEQIFDFFFHFFYLQSEFESKLLEEREKMRTLEEALQLCRVSSGELIRNLFNNCIKSSEKLVTRATSENDVAAAAGTSSYFMMIAEELTTILNELAAISRDFRFDDNDHVTALTGKTILIGHAMASVYIQGVTICKTSANIESGERKKFKYEIYYQSFVNVTMCTILF